MWPTVNRIFKRNLVPHGSKAAIPSPLASQPISLTLPLSQTTLIPPLLVPHKSIYTASNSSQAPARISKNNTSNEQASQHADAQIVINQLSKEELLSYRNLKKSIYNGKHAEFNKLIHDSNNLLDYRDTHGFFISHYVVIAGNIKMLKDIIALSKLHFNEVNNNNASILYMACFFGKEDIVETLIEYAKNNKSIYLKDYINRKTKQEGWSCVQAAVFCDNKKIIEQLIENGANINSLSKNKENNVLYYAARSNQAEMVEFLINKGADISNGTDEDCFSDSLTPLYIAAEYGYLEIVKLLVNEAKKRGSDYLKKYINKKTGVRKRPPLHVAVANLHLEIVEFLLKEKGIDCIAKNAKGHSALDTIIAIKSSKRFNPNLVLAIENALQEILNKRGLGPTGLPTEGPFSKDSLIKLVKRGYPIADHEKLKNLIQNALTPQRGMTLQSFENDVLIHGDDNSERSTWLHALVRPTCKNMIDAVMEKIKSEFPGFDINRYVNTNNLTVFYRAAFFGNLPAIDTLIKYGANVTIACKDGWTPLMVAAWLGNKPVLEKIIGRLRALNLYEEQIKSEINKVTEKGKKSALFRTVQARQIECVVYLKEQGANINIEDSYGVTPLHMAVRLGAPQMVDILLEHGANPQAQASQGKWTPLHYAYVHNTKYTNYIVRILLDRGADPKAKDCAGRTYIDIAKSKNLLPLSCSNDMFAKDLTGTRTSEIFGDLAIKIASSKMVKVGHLSEPKEKFDFVFKLKEEAFIKFLKDEVVPYVKKLHPKADKAKCFISYAWGQRYYEYKVERLVHHLEAAGFETIFDRWEDHKGQQVTYFVEKMAKADFLLVIGTPLYLQKYEKRAESAKDREHVVRLEGSLLNYLASCSTRRADKIIPLLFEGDAEDSLPFLLTPHMPVDFVHQDYFEGMLKLVHDMYRVPNRDEGFQELVENFKQKALSVSLIATPTEIENYRREAVTKLQEKQEKINREVRRDIDEAKLTDKGQPSVNGAPHVAFFHTPSKEVSNAINLPKPTSVLTASENILTPSTRKL